MPVLLLLVLLLQKAARPAYDDDAMLSIRVAGADLTGPLAFLTLMGGVYYGWQRSQTAGARRKQGRWVYDRSMGGKKVWWAKWGWVGGWGGALLQLAHIRMQWASSLLRRWYVAIPGKVVCSTD